MESFGGDRVVMLIYVDVTRCICNELGRERSFSDGEVLEVVVGGCDDDWWFEIGWVNLNSGDEEW